MDFVLNHYESILQSLGGLGLFLLGIIILTEGLRSLAGDSIRSALIRFTKSPYSGALTGAISTAILQSSSATTVAAVGFVGAGLLSFSESLGIIFGANIGTTITGWFVVLLGFKLKLGTMILPLIFFGALLRLFAKGKMARFGYTLAGFSIIFVGITMMQEGMAVFSQFVNPSDLPSDGILGRLKIILIGIIFTIITQSSSAGVAATLSALYAGMVNFEQAAALVIGMDVGTTITAFLATIGQSIEARRTGLSHVIYNILTAIGALFLISPFTYLVGGLMGVEVVENAEVLLVAFHSTFNFIGLVVILPFTGFFSLLMFKVVPQEKVLYTKKLDTMLLDEPRIALTAVQNSIADELAPLLKHLKYILGAEQSSSADLMQLQKDLDATHAYLDKISLEHESGAQWERLVSMLHTLDHMQRLHERCDEEEERAITIRDSDKLEYERRTIIQSVNAILKAIESKQWHRMYKSANSARLKLNKHLKPSREKIISQIAKGDMDVQEGTDYLEGVRWVKRVSLHLARISYHYEQMLMNSAK